MRSDVAYLAEQQWEGSAYVRVSLAGWLPRVNAR